MTLPEAPCAPGRPQAPGSVSVKVYGSLDAAAPFLAALARSPGPWVFDIETYDAAEFPSRKHVSVDPFHPDFRVRGVAVAWRDDVGAWVELNGDPAGLGRRLRPRGVEVLCPVGIAALRAAFASDAEKGAFNGGFDDCGLVYPGWVPRVRNRTRDGMLSMVGLGDGTHERLTLQHAAAVLLGADPHWVDVDKGQMRGLPIDVVAEGSVRDACLTYALCDLLDGEAAEERHIEWSKIPRAPERGVQCDPWEGGAGVDEYS